MYSTIFTMEYMSTEESSSESDEGENTGQRKKALVVHKVPWRSAKAEEIIQTLDRKIVRKKSSRSAEMCRKQCHGEPSTVHKPLPLCPAWAKIDD